MSNAGLTIAAPLTPRHSARWPRRDQRRLAFGQQRQLSASIG
jgi:hypothetical protein